MTASSTDVRARRDGAGIKARRLGSVPEGQLAESGPAGFVDIVDVNPVRDQMRLSGCWAWLLGFLE